MDLFRNVYVINLDKDTTRLAKLSSNLAKYNIKYTRVSGVNGKQLTDEQLKDKTTLACRTLFCTKGIVGSTLSHYKTWELISRSSDKWHLVLEDDVEFNEKSMKLFEQLSAHLAAHPEIDAFININCHNPHQLFCQFGNEMLGNNIFAGGASAYLLTPTTAKKFLLKYKKVYGYVDGTLALTLHDKTMLITKDRYVKHDFNLYQSSNMQLSVMPILAFLLTKIKLDEIAFFLNVPLLTIAMTFQISTYVIIFTVLLCTSVYFRNLPIFAYLLAELVTYIILKTK